MLNVQGTRERLGLGEAEVGGGFFCAHISPTPTNVQVESRELVALAQQRGREMDPMIWEQSREEQSGEIQEGISKEEAHSWASVERLDRGLSRWGQESSISSPLSLHLLLSIYQASTTYQTLRETHLKRHRKLK